MKVLKVLIFIIAIVMIFIMIKMIISIMPELFKEERYYYECIDTFGNSVVCEKIYNSYGQLWGITQDGTAVQITKGKKVIEVEQ